MTFVTWSENLSLSVDQFDDHHKHLIGLINSTYEKFMTRDNDLGTLFDELIDYATYHFSAEEYWMEKQLYPKLALHKVEHAYFSRRVKEMHKDFVAGDSALGLEVLTFMKNWLIYHIAESDSEYGRFAHSNF